MYKIIFQIGPVTLYSYGLCVAIGVLVPMCLMIRDAKKAGVSANVVIDCFVALFVGGLIGGRLLFVGINWEYYVQYPLHVFMINEGGLAFQGAFAGAILSGLIAVKVKKLSFWKMSDLIAPYIALGQAIGRVGCFLNGCCYGKIIEKGIGITLPGETIARVPTQIYSSIGLFFIFMILKKNSPNPRWKKVKERRDKKLFDGHLFCMYIVLYSIFRFFMDFLRGDNPIVLAGMTLSQVISVGMLLCGTGMYLVLKFKMKNEK